VKGLVQVLFQVADAQPTERIVQLPKDDSEPLKPDPQGAWQIARELGVPSRHCAFVGDSGVDIQTAVNAKMIGIGGAYGS
jgi:phosphoglycolate phosphatase